MTGVRFELVDETGVAPFASRLRELERTIQYPIADGADRFTIDHGPDYSPFFSGMGEAYFLLALRGDELLGSIAGVIRTVHVAGREARGLYVCDLKVRADARGTGLARRLLLRGLLAIAQTPSARRCRLLYGAGMRGQRGDVMRSARGLNALRLGSPLARLAVYFPGPQQLLRLDPSGAPPPPIDGGIELGPLAHTEVSDTQGRKDFVLDSTGAPWPLVHLPLGPAAWRPTWGHYLRACGEELVARGRSGPACFAIDERLADHVGWLRSQGIVPGAVCTVYALSLGLSVRRARWVHLPSSEI
jgi:GNAT superfamily N-acetyltransferase